MIFGPSSEEHFTAALQSEAAAQAARQRGDHDRAQLLLRDVEWQLNGAASMETQEHEMRRWVI